MRLGSLFTGYGGLDPAVEEFFGARTVWCSDIDPGAQDHRSPLLLWDLCLTLLLPDHLRTHHTPPLALSKWLCE
jgi:hypothetical protein